MYRCWKWYSEMLLAAFARQSRIFDSFDALHAFYRMPKCLNWRNILSRIPFGSDLDLNYDNLFFIFFFKGERIQISLKAGHHRSTSETPLNSVSLACPWWPTLNAGLVVLRISGDPVQFCQEILYFCDFSGVVGVEPLYPLWIRAWDRTTENPFYRAHWLLYDTLRTFYRSTSRERDMRVLFEFPHFFNSENCLRFSKICVDLCKKFWSSDSITF